MGQPTARMTASAHSSSGMRRADRPPVPDERRRHCRRRAHQTRVSVGQNQRARCHAHDGRRACGRIRSSIDPTSHGIALPASRRLMPRDPSAHAPPRRRCRRRYPSERPRLLLSAPRARLRNRFPHIHGNAPGIRIALIAFAPGTPVADTVPPLHACDLATPRRRRTTRKNADAAWAVPNGTAAAYTAMSLANVCGLKNLTTPQRLRTNP